MEFLVKELAGQYRSALLEDVIPFWEQHSIELCPRRFFHLPGAGWKRIRHR